MGGLRRRNRILKAGKSPSRMAMERTYKRAILNGGVTQDFSANVENIREISRKLGYNILKTPINRNLFAFSDDFTQSYWQSTTPFLVLSGYSNMDLDPYGNLTADRIIPNNTLNIHRFQNPNFLIYSGTTYTVSFYVKKNGYDYMFIREGLDGVIANNTVFNLALGTITTLTNGRTATITPAPNGYYRISVTTLCSLTVSTAIGIGVSDNNGITCTGDNVKYNIVWGAQLEIGDTPTTISQYAPENTNANFLYVPSSYGEGKNFAQVQNKRNLLQWSEEFNNALWIKQNSTITTNVSIAPDGALTADKLISANGFAGVTSQAFTVVSGTTYTLSIYAKKAEFSYLRVSMTTGLFPPSNRIGVFNLNNGTIGTATQANTNAKITEVTNGYYRCSITLTAISSGTATTTFGDNLDDSLTAVGNGTSGIYIWGAQLEAGAYATLYQKTVAAGDGIVDFNFTRATSARVTNKLGVIEDSCYNLLQRSEEFNTTWAPVRGTITPNATTNPITGALTADKYIKGIGNFPWYINQSIQVSTNNYYCYSVYTKSAGELTAAIGTTSEASGVLASSINFTAGSISTPSNNANWINTSSSIIHIIDGWYLVTIIGRRIGASATITFSLGTNFGNSSGNGVDGVYFWGAQLVQGSTPRPYLRTTNRLNVPRLDYSRGTEEPELLIERASTNLALQSATFDNANWQKVNTLIVANAIQSPDNNFNADKVNETSANGNHYVQYNSVTKAINDITTYSVYLKAAERTNISLHLNENNLAFPFCNFNLQTATIGSSSGVTNPTIINVGDGWYRCSFSRTTVNVGGTSVSIFSTIGDELISYIGTSGFGFYAWGVQSEIGANITSYIPTTTVAVTRNAETSYVDLFNNSALNRTNWTLFWEVYMYDGHLTNGTLYLSDVAAPAGDTNQIGWSGARPIYNISNVRTNGSIVITNNTLNKLAIQYNNGIVNFYLNGVNIWANRSVATFDYRYLVLNSGGSTFTTDKISLFNRTLTDIECINLTT